MSAPDAIYIHIPFCKKRCHYCAFTTFSAVENEMDRYFSYLMKELELFPKSKYDTVYLGGGTPSFVKVGLLEELINRLDIDPNAEFTIEVNPDTVDIEKLKKYKKLGINRLSIGCQSFNDRILKVLGRTHDVAQIFKVYETARSLGFGNINLDLIFSTPYQDMEILKNDLETITKLSPEHISIYSLSWEENSEFSKMKELKANNEDFEADMYQYIINFLKSNGYRHYEISAFCKDGFESRHNSKYWRCNDYIGLGLSAAGYMDGCWYKNYSTFKEYYAAIDKAMFPRDEINNFSEKELIENQIIFGLRLLEEGVDFNGLLYKYSKPAVEIYINKAETLVEQGLLIKDGMKYRLSGLAVAIANEVFMEFLGLS